MPLQVTEDTPPDMLAGSMDLLVALPNGRTVKMNVERSTPMMDLLVQATTLNKISPGGHVLQPLGERGVLPYKPSTPIGALDAWTIQVVPKAKAQTTTTTTTVQKKAPLKPLNQQQQPFEQTFRLQVHLPRNQLYVMRVSPRTLLSDILQQTCSEKNLDPSKYEMRHPANLSQLLSPSCTLADYGLQEVTVVARSSRAPGLGSSDIMALQREEDKRRQQARQQHGSNTGVAIVFNKRSQSSVCEGSVSSDSLGGRSISPARSDESASRSASPPAPSLPAMMAPPPARPARKRRPAPKPPGPSKPEATVQAEASNVPVSHSRNSSDSSGYHEASVLSDSPPDVHQMGDSSAPDTLPRRGKQVAARAKSQGGLSRSMSSLHSTSNTSLASSTGHGQKKKKAPPPPPGVAPTKDDMPLNKTTSLERHWSGKTITEVPDKCSTLPGKMKMTYERRTPSPEVKIPEEFVSVPSSVASESSRVSSPEVKMPEETCRVSSPEVLTQEETSRTPSPEVKAPEAASRVAPPEMKAPEEISRVSSPEETCRMSSPVPEVISRVSAPEEASSPLLAPVDCSTTAPPVEFASETEDDVDQVEEAFRSVTAELEAAIKRDEELNVLPPPPVVADDTAVDWEYQLPAPPSAFRDKDDSPTNSTVALADAQVFDVASLSPEPQEVDSLLSRAIHRTNPLFTPHDTELPEPSNESKKTASTHNEHFVRQDLDTHIAAVSSDSQQPREIIQETVSRSRDMQETVLETNSRHLRQLSKDSRAKSTEEVLESNSRDLRQLSNDNRPRDTKEVSESNYKDSRQPSKDNRSRGTEEVLDSNSRSSRPPSKDTEEVLNSNSRSSRQLSKDTEEVLDSNSRSSRQLSKDNRSRGTEEVLDSNSRGSRQLSKETEEVLDSNSRGSRHENQESRSRNLSESNSQGKDVPESRSIEARQYRTDSLTNFTITTYQRPRVTEEIFNEDNDEDGRVFRKPGSLSMHQKFGSMSALNRSGNNLSRTNSFNDDDANTFKQPGQAPSVKRSTSYISLIANPTSRVGRPFQPSYAPMNSRTKSVGNLHHQEDLQACATPPLQCIKVLKSILPQLEQQQSRNSAAPKSLDESVNESTKQNNEPRSLTASNEAEPKRYVYRGPPAVNFTTWSERPKSQVSIKMDGDYRIGVGQAGHNEEKPKPAEPLTMHLVSHTEVRKPAQKIETKETQQSDPSRIPIVRSVELKKSFIQQQSLNKSCTLLNGTDQRNGSEEGFLGVNSLAKRFSVPVSNGLHSSRPVSAYGKIETTETKSYGKNEVAEARSAKVEISRKVGSTDSKAQSRRYTSVIGINSSEPDHSLSSSSFREPRGPSVVRVNGFTAPKQLMPVVKGFQFAAPAANKVQRSESTTSAPVRTWKTELSEPPPPPPLAASLRKSTARPRPKTLPAASANPRDQLMDAIRNFGGRENLRQVCNSRDNVVLIR